MSEHCYWCKCYNGYRCELWQADVHPEDEACPKFTLDYDKEEE